MDLTALLKKLSETTGISGHEANFRSVVLDEWGCFAHETRTDKMGNAIAIRRGVQQERPSTDMQPERSRAAAQSKAARGMPVRRIMLASHMDEIGLMVAGINRGFIRVSPIGGVDPRALLAQEVIVHGRRALPGVIASTPPHLLKASDRDKIILIDKLWIDVGLPAKQVERLVQVGDLVSIQRRVSELKGGLLTGKAFDNRASVAAVAVCLEHLQTIQHQWDVIAVATVQEETALLGAATAAFGLAPDAAIAIDVTYGKQDGASSDETFVVGGGPTIGIGPNMHPKMTQGLLDAARRIELDAHLEPMPGSSQTDGWAIQVARDGIPTGLVEIPIRSMHTPVETVSPKDVERAGRLLAEFIASLDEAFYQSLTEG